MKNMSYKINVTLSKTLKQKPAPGQSLGFGKIFTDHMFIMDYSGEKGWYDPRIVPYGPLSIDPATMVFHYGQAIFEGLKAYRSDSGDILLFRPEKNIQRLNTSNERITIPHIDEEIALEAIRQLILLEKDWIPSEKGSSLYIRPFIIATDPILGVHPSNTYKYMIILSPSGNYYPGGLAPVKIYVEDEYVRAVRGGTGYAKAAGNYAASLLAQKNAETKGFVQVLWLDGIERKYIEEVGAMNVFFKINGEFVTPSLTGSILPGITRMSVMEMLNSLGMKVSEKRISVQELFDANEKGILEEAFGTGTAAVISPIGELFWNGRSAVINNGKIGSVSQKLYDTLTGIQYGRIEDPFGWSVKL